ncbi:hypothetical protein LZ496_02490 [Sphingomonas sp. NSE70-1]|uniref:Uncharacterized protein n=1 Tax=Sphingomonas caseinilyticus TaxID=2908205 RepID=A0ABT0RRL3_9SPHN|nr:hypothetical protein [Sphingomonas caseinilyticus]MCL6697653.1 hypothetical protein [Sphingomonas caseinilyticus]
MAAATKAPPPTSGEKNAIIVQGERLSEGALEERASEFVRATGVASGKVPAARWIDPVCVQVQGLEAAGKRAAEAKMRSIAASAGIEVASESCRPNIVVNFTADGAGLAQEIQRRDPRRIGQLTPRARDSILTSSAPIRWIYSTELRGRDGQIVNADGGAGQTAPATHDGSGAGSALGGDMTMMHYENSIVSTLTNRILTSAIVIIDTDHAMGRKLDSLAAYAALVAFAEIRNPDAAPDGSILGMFASSTPPRGLTPQDTAFLRALYRIPLDREAMRHRGQLVHEITRELAANHAL